jgi:hypothetical protein
MSAFTYAGLFTAFALFSGVENAEGGKGFWSNLPNVLPWLPVWCAVFIAWKKPGIGGLLFLFLAAASVSFFHTYQGLIPFSLISLPLIIIGIVFLTKSGRMSP